MNKTTHQAAKVLEYRLPDWKLSYRIEEAVAATGIGRTILYRRIKEGKLKARKEGSFRIILRDDLKAYLDNLPAVQS